MDNETLNQFISIWRHYVEKLNPPEYALRAACKEAT